MDKFILSKAEQKQLKLIWYLLNKDNGDALVDEITEVTGISEPLITYYIEKIHNKIDEIFGKKIFRIHKRRNRVQIENFDFFSFQVVRSGYLSNSFFIYFFKEVYHKRFINLAEAVEKRYISYETGKRELLKCKRYLYQFDLTLKKKRKVIDVVEGREKSQRFMYFSLILKQYGHDFELFLELIDNRVTEFLKGLMQEFGVLSTPNLLKIEIFYHICFDRMKQGYFVPSELDFPDYIHTPFLSFKEFCRRISPLFETINIGDNKVKYKEMEMLYFWFSTLIVGLEMQESTPFKGQFIVPKSIISDEYCHLIDLKYFKLSSKEKKFIRYSLHQYFVYHQMFGIAYCPYEYVYFKDDVGTKADMLWEKLRKVLISRELFHMTLMRHPTLEFYMKEIFQILLYYSKKECRIFLCIYSSIAYQKVVDKLRQRFVNTSFQFVNTPNEADIVISEMPLRVFKDDTPIICFINSILIEKEWKNIDIAITKWEVLQNK